MTGDALFRTHGTRVRIATRGLRLSRFGYVAGETLRIVIRGVFLQFLVWVMTGDTAKPQIVRVVPATIEHAVRLEPNVVDARLSRLQHRLLETRMTRATKRLRLIVRTQISRIEDLQSVQFLRFRGDKVLLAWSMTRFTADARA